MPLMLSASRLTLADWQIENKPIEAIHFFEPSQSRVLFSYPHGYIRLDGDNEVTAIDGVSTVSTRQDTDFTLMEHFMTPPIGGWRGWNLFLCLPLIAERWEVQTKSPKAGCGDTQQCFDQLQLYHARFLSRLNSHAGHLYLQGHWRPVNDTSRA